MVKINKTSSNDSVNYSQKFDNSAQRFHTPDIVEETKHQIVEPKNTIRIYNDRTRNPMFGKDSKSTNKHGNANTTPYGGRGLSVVTNTEPTSRWNKESSTGCVSLKQ